MKKKILITGGAGFIGSCLSHYLKDKFRIYVLDKNPLKPWQKINENKFYRCNLLNIKKSETIIKKINPNIIIHLAALSTVNEKFTKKNYFLNNVKTTKNILLIMNKLKVNNIIYSSTAAVYDNKDIKIKENSKLNPINKYGYSKLNAEKLIKGEKLNYIIFRFFNVASALSNFPIGEFHDPETHLIPSLIYNSKKNFISKIYGNNYTTHDGTCIRDYIHIRDICNAILKGIKLIEKRKIKSVLNLGNGKGYSNLQILNSINKYLKIKIKFSFSKKRKGDPKKLVCSIKKAQKTLNWSPKFSSLKKIISDENIWQNFLLKKNFTQRQFN